MARLLTAHSGQTLRVSTLSWNMVLRLAFDHGWKPLGTAEPPGYRAFEPDGFTTKQWNPGDYFSGEGQTVAMLDALAIADSLDRAMPDIPDHDAIGHKVLAILDFPFAPPLRVLDRSKRIHPFEYFSGRNKPRLVRFAEFARLGAFTISRFSEN